ncbi:MAG: hypothetical protein KF689_02710 [Gemmatimonadaceae bacterium]|nr:hypothetical protein [Gemmatimonadaceae bacterium]MCW5827642.1 hypothetical protein [Gemmatimonadaceae bacterium]
MISASAQLRRLATAALAATLLLPSSAQAQDDAKAFVDRFLAVYHSQFEQEEERSAEWDPVAAVAAFFTPQLARALAEDRAAAVASTEEIVGLDFDPFSNSQDPCETYRTGRSAQRADTVMVEILGDCHGQIPLIPDAVFLLVRRDGSFAIADIAYPQGGSLLGILRHLAEMRRQSPPTLEALR